MLLRSETKIEPDLRLPNYKLFHISKKGTYSGSAISSSKQLSRWNWEHTESLFCSFVPLISSLVFIAGRNAMLRSPYLLTDQHLHSPTPVVPSISAPSTPLHQHGISSVDNVSSVLQKGTWRFYNGHVLFGIKEKNYKRIHIWFLIRVFLHLITMYNQHLTDT